MKLCQKYFSAGLMALAVQAAFAGSAFAASASTVAVLAGPAVTCTDSTINGSVDIFAPVPAGSSVTQTNCTITGAIHTGDGTSTQDNTAFLAEYAKLAQTTCGTVLTTL